MKTVELRGMTIGDGTVRICYPMTSRTEDELFKEAEEASISPCDFVEWRIDFFDGLFHKGRVMNALSELRIKIGNKPILFVLRTGEDGGPKEIPEDYYFNINEAAINSGKIDAIDIELGRERERADRLIKMAKDAEIAVLISKHIYEKTPTQAEIISLLRKIQGTGADISKLAVMAYSSDDAERVIESARIMHSEYSTTPFIAVAMGKEGQITRKIKPFFGSSITYARGKHSVSPGQLSIDELLGE